MSDDLRDRIKNFEKRISEWRTSEEGNRCFNYQAYSHSLTNAERLERAFKAGIASVTTNEL